MDNLSTQKPWQKPFTRAEALAMWARLAAGWAHSLDETGARTLLPGITLPDFPDQGGSFEGVTRMLWGIGGWLSQPGRSPTVTWRGETFDLAALMQRALAAGCDSDSPSCWGSTLGQHHEQRTVEAGHVMFTVWQARQRVWAAMDGRQRAAVLAFHELYGRRPPFWPSNWALFWMLNHASRKALGQPYDQALIDSVLDEYVEGVYCGDGWYDDAPQRGWRQFDDYNWWVFGSHLLAWCMVDGDSRPDKRAQILERTRLLMQHYPYFFAADGAYTEYGRSLIYKFARLGVALWAYKLGAWPHPLGMLKRLVGRHLRWYIDRGALDGGGALIQPLTYQGSEEIRDPYNATGSPYWAMQAFGALWSLADDDPFWTADEAPLPVEQGDFVRVLPQPGWVLVGAQASGQVQRFIAGSTHRPPVNPAKYEKYVYATAAPFNTGLVNGAPSPDAMLCLSDGQSYGHRWGNLAWAVGKPGWLRMRYAETIAGREHLIDTTIVCLGESHLRAHRVHLAVSSGTVGAVEGAAAFGYTRGVAPDVVVDATRQVVVVSEHDRCMAIRGLSGYDGQSVTSAWGGHTHLNSVYGAYLLPMLTVATLKPVHDLVCLVYIGGGGQADVEAAARRIAATDWQDDGSFVLRLSDGLAIAVPPLQG